MRALLASLAFSATLLLSPIPEAECNSCMGRPCGPSYCPGGCVCAGYDPDTFRMGRCVG